MHTAVEDGGQRARRFVGYVVGVFFWALLLSGIMSLLALSGDSGVGYLWSFVQLLLSQFFYLSIIPIAIIAYTMHRGAQRGRNPWASFFIGGTVGCAAYLGILLVLGMMMLY